MLTLIPNPKPASIEQCVHAMNAANANLALTLMGRPLNAADVQTALEVMVFTLGDVNADLKALQKR